jgi:hypothetical protein
LTRIFHQNFKLLPTTSGRLLRYATFLSAFDYEVVFKKGIDNHDDWISRARVVLKEFSGNLSINSAVNCVCMASEKEISTEWLNADAVRNTTDSDEQLSKTKLKYKTTQSFPMSIP